MNYKQKIRSKLTQTFKLGLLTATLLTITATFAYLYTNDNFTIVNIIGFETNIGSLTLSILLLILTTVTSLTLNKLPKINIYSSDLARESDRNSLILHNIRDGLHIVDGEGNILEVSDSFCSMLRRSREEVLQLNIMDIDIRFSNPNNHEILNSMLQRSSKTALVTKLRRKDNSLVDVQINAISVIYDKKHALYSSAEEISNLKWAEIAQREALSRLEKIAHRIPGVVFQYRLRPDGTSCFPFASDALQDIYRVNPSEVHDDSLKVFSTIHPDDLIDFKKSLNKSAKDLCPWRLEYRVMFSDGTVKWHYGNALPEREPDGATLWHGHILDITEKKQTEATLRKLSWAVEQSPESIVITDIKGNIEYINEAFIKNTGYKSEEVIGKRPSILKSGKTPDFTYKIMWDTIIQGDIWKGELSNKRKDGSEYIEFAKISPIRDPNGRITHFVALKEDITNKKLIAQELEQHRNHLEDQVIARTAELAREKNTSDSANRAKSEFLTNLSHEIRTPLNAIIGLTHILRRDSSINSRQASQLDKVEISGKHLLSVINDVLDLAKIESGRLQLENINFQIRDLLKSVLDMFSESADEKGLKLEIDINNIPNELSGDPTRIRQALVNFVGNALKFTKQGSILLRASIALPENNLHNTQIAEDEIFILFEVIDTGIGIESYNLDRIFDSFEQSDGSITRKYGGTGLGLAISRRIAQMMDGNIGVKSEVGVGSNFWFSARLKHAIGFTPINSPLSTDDAAAVLRHSHRGARILLVEDNLINREIASELLEWAELVIEIAVDGLEALDMVTTRRYDLVLMDIQMPRMDGFAATRAIRLHDDLKDLPILAITANAFSDDRIACQNSGMNDFIAKPMDPAELYNMILRWLPRHETNIQ